MSYQMKIKKMLHADATNLYGHSMSQMLPYDEIEMWHGHPDLYMKLLEEIINTSVESDIVYFVELDLKYPYNMKEKTNNFPFCPENKIIPKEKYNDHMHKIKPKKIQNLKSYYVIGLTKRTICFNIKC